MSEQQPPSAGWDPPPQPRTGPGVRPAVDSKPPFYRRGWFPLAAFLVGAIVGGALGLAAAGSPEPQTRTVTEVSVQEIPTFKESCSDYTRVEDIAACRKAQENREAAPTTSSPPVTRPDIEAFTDGVYEVGAEIKPGTYKTPGGADCYYARLRSDDTSDIITNNSSTGPQTVRVRPTDKFVEFSGGCEWGGTG
jgi:hypothetical protein